MRESVTFHEPFPWISHKKLKNCQYTTNGRARCSTLQFEAYFGYFIAFQSPDEWTPSKGGNSVFYCDLAVKMYFSTSLHHTALSRRALWRELVVRVSLLKLSRSVALNVSPLPLSILCVARCWWWCAAACGWRLCRFILQKENMQFYGGGSSEGTARVSEDRVPAGHFSFLFEKKSGANHSAHRGQRKQ